MKHDFYKKDFYEKDLSLEQTLKKALSVSEEPDERLNRRIIIRAKENFEMSGKISENKITKKTWRVSVAAFAAVVMLFAGSVGVYAGVRYLTARDVAEQIGRDEIAKIFEGKDAIFINESQVIDDVKITLLGVASGKKLSEYAKNQNGSIQSDCIYVVTAIENVDGTKRADTSNEEFQWFFTSPFVKGLNPNYYNAMTLNGGITSFVQDGIQYQLAECDNMTVFADRGLYVGVNENISYDSSAYCFDEVTGEIIANPEYKGISVVFELLLPESFADKEAAQKIMDEMESFWNGEGTIDTDKNVSEAENGTEKDTVEDIFAKEWTKERLEEEAVCMEDTIDVIVPDAEGIIRHSFTVGNNGMGGEIVDTIDNLFPDHEVGIPRVAGGMQSDTWYLEVYELNEDGTVTFSVYQVK